MAEGQTLAQANMPAADVAPEANADPAQSALQQRQDHGRELQLQRTLTSFRDALYDLSQNSENPIALRQLDTALSEMRVLPAEDKVALAERMEQERPIPGFPQATPFHAFLISPVGAEMRNLMDQGRGRELLEPGNRQYETMIAFFDPQALTVAGKAIDILNDSKLQPNEGDAALNQLANTVTSRAIFAQVNEIVEMLHPREERDGATPAPDGDARVAAPAGAPAATRAQAAAQPPQYIVAPAAPQVIVVEPRPAIIVPRVAYVPVLPIPFLFRHHHHFYGCHEGRPINFYRPHREHEEHHRHEGHNRQSLAVHVGPDRAGFSFLGHNRAAEVNVSPGRVRGEYQGPHRSGWFSSGRERVSAGFEGYQRAFKVTVDKAQPGGSRIGQRNEGHHQVDGHYNPKPAPRIDGHHDNATSKAGHRDERRNPGSAGRHEPPPARQNPHPPHAQKNKH